MQNEDILFAKKVVELNLIQEKHIKKCYLVKQQSLQQGKNISLSQIAINLEFITQRQVDTIQRFINQQDPKLDTSNSRTEFLQDSPTNNSKPSSSTKINDFSMNSKNQFNRYVIEEKLGEGGMGTVYKVRDNQLRRSVALKIITGSSALNQKQIQRFLNEARATASLKHPNIVEVYEIGTEPQNYFTMELIQGYSFSQLIRQTSLTHRKIVEIMIKCAQAIHYAHKKGIIHRDIKPSNIMMENGKEPKIMDFGLAKDAENDQQLSKTGDVVGTAVYMSPEQAKGKTVDARSDVYSLGASLYEALTKRPPFQGEDSMNILYQIFTEDPIEPHLLNSDIPSELEAICLKCLQKKTEKRYQSAREFAKDLDNFICNRPVRAKPITSWVRIKKSISRNRMLFSFVVIFIITLTISIFSYISVLKEARKLSDESKIAANLSEIKVQKSYAEAKEALYKANIALANLYNNENRIANAHIVLKKAKENEPQAENFWEYRWQKNRNRFELNNDLLQFNKDESVKDIAISKNGTIVILNEGSVVFFNPSENKRIRNRLKTPSNCCAISFDGSWAAVGDRKGILHLWNTITYKKYEIQIQETIPKNHRDKEDKQQITDLSFSRDGSKLLVARQTIDKVIVKKFEHFLQSLLLVDVTQKKIIKQFAIPNYQKCIRKTGSAKEFINADFTSCDLSNNVIIGATEDNYIYNFSLKKIRSFGPHQARIVQSTIHPRYKKFIVSASEYNLYFWDQSLWKPDLKMQSPVKIPIDSRIQSFSFSPDGNKIAISTKSGKIQIYTVINTDGKISINEDKRHELIGHTTVNACVFSTDGKNIFSGGNGVKFWSITAKSRFFTKDLQSPSITAAFHPTKNIIAIGQAAGAIIVDILSHKQITKNGISLLGIHLSSLSHVQFSKSGFLYTSGFDGMINIWDVDKFIRKQKYYVGSNIGIEKFSHVNDGKRIIAVGENNHVYSLDLANDGTIIRNKIYNMNDLKNKSPKLSHLRNTQDKHTLNYISYNGRNLVAVSGNGNYLYIVNSKKMELQNRFHIKVGGSKCLIHYNTQKEKNYIFICHRRKIIKCEIKDNSLHHIEHFVGHTSEILWITKNETQIISCDKGGDLHFWPLFHTRELIPIDNKIPQRDPSFTLRTKGLLNFCSFDSTNSKIAVCGGDNNDNLFEKNNAFLKLWNASDYLERNDE